MRSNQSFPLKVLFLDLEHSTLTLLTEPRKSRSRKRVTSLPAKRSRPMVLLVTDPLWCPTGGDINFGEEF